MSGSPRMLSIYYVMNACICSVCTDLEGYTQFKGIQRNSSEILPVPLF